MPHICITVRPSEPLLSGFWDHIRSSSSREHINQDWQNDEDENGREQDASHNDQSERALNLCTDRR